MEGRNTCAPLEALDIELLDKNHPGMRLGASRRVARPRRSGLEVYRRYVAFLYRRSNQLHPQMCTCDGVVVEMLWGGVVNYSSRALRVDRVWAWHLAGLASRPVPAELHQMRASQKYSHVVRVTHLNDRLATKLPLRVSDNTARFQTT